MCSYVWGVGVVDVSLCSILCEVRHEGGRGGANILPILTVSQPHLPSHGTLLE
jgi:hypothetical protein